MELKKSRYASELFSRIDEEKRQRILKTAISEFSENGFANANVNHIAEDSGISVGSLYKYFETKDDLYMYIVNDSSQKIREYIFSIIKQDSSISEKIQRLLHIAYDYSMEDPTLIKLYDVITSDNDPRRAQIIADKLEGQTAEAYITILSQAQKNGEVRDDIDAGVLAFMVDNQLMATQFAFANSYYKKRFMLYHGSKSSLSSDAVINDMHRAIMSMIEPK